MVSPEGIFNALRNDCDAKYYSSTKRRPLAIVSRINSICVLYKSISCWCSFEMNRQVDAIRMGTHKICLYEVDKTNTGCNLKTTELLDRVLIGVCAVIKSNICYM